MSEWWSLHKEKLLMVSSKIHFWKPNSFLIWMFMMSLDSSQFPLCTPVVCLYTITICKLLDALEGNKGLFWKEELPPRAFHSTQGTWAQVQLSSAARNLSSPCCWRFFRLTLGGFPPWRACVWAYPWLPGPCKPTRWWTGLLSSTFSMLLWESAKGGESGVVEKEQVEGAVKLWIPRWGRHCLAKQCEGCERHTARCHGAWGIVLRIPALVHSRAQT